MKRIPVIGLMMVFAVCVQAANENWMTGLPDTVRVCRVSIPGTHDSGTSGVWFPMRHYARTQSMDLAEQWDAGIRFFDLRPKLDGDRLRIYHGPASCHITFEESLLILKHKIEENPTEFCIVMTNSAGGGRKAVDMTMEQIRKSIPDNVLAVFKPDMTVLVHDAIFIECTLKYVQQSYQYSHPYGKFSQSFEPYHEHWPELSLNLKERNLGQIYFSCIICGTSRQNLVHNDTECDGAQSTNLITLFNRS